MCRERPSTNLSHSTLAVLHNFGVFVFTKCWQWNVTCSPMSINVPPSQSRPSTPPTSPPQWQSSGFLSSPTRSRRVIDRHLVFVQGEELRAKPRSHRACMCSLETRSPSGQTQFPQWLYPKRKWFRFQNDIRTSRGHEGSGWISSSWVRILSTSSTAVKLTGHIRFVRLVRIDKLQGLRLGHAWKTIVSLRGEKGRKERKTGKIRKRKGKTKTNFEKLYTEENDIQPCQ